MEPPAKPSAAGSLGRGGAAERASFRPFGRKQGMRSLRRRAAGESAGVAPPPARPHLPAVRTVSPSGGGGSRSRLNGAKGVVPAGRPVVPGKTGVFRSRKQGRPAVRGGWPNSCAWLPGYACDGRDGGADAAMQSQRKGVSVTSKIFLKKDSAGASYFQMVRVLCVADRSPQAPCMRATERSEALSES